MTRRAIFSPRCQPLGLLLILLAGLFLAACEAPLTPDAPLDAASDTPAALPTVNLQRLELSPARIELAAGTRLKAQVTGLYSDGSRRDLADEVTWSSADTGLLDVDGGGLLRALKAGSTRLRARLGELQAETPVQVSAARLEGIEITPDILQLPAGSTQQVSAIGLFGDGSRQSLADQVSWSSTDTSLLTVTATGHVQALKPGSAVLRASLNGVFGQVTVSISDAELTALRITPANLRLPAGTDRSLALVGLYGDGSQRDVTAQAQWQSSDAQVVALSGRELSALQPGEAVVRATLAGVSAELPVSVSDAELLSLELGLGEGDLPAGLTRSLRAIGHFSDGRLQDLSRRVVWRSSDETVLAVANAAGREGLATALATGTAMVQASLGEVSVEVALQVSDALLQSLEVEPVAVRLAAGTQRPLTVLGRYSDGGVRDLTDRVSWSSDAPATATALNGGERPGLLRGLVEGQSVIRARLGELVVQVPVTVSAATLLAIDIVPSTISLAAGSSLSLRAVGSFSDGSTQTLKDGVNWESAETRIASVDSAGNLLALVAGDGRVSASFSGVTGSVPLRVTPAILQALEISPATAQLASGTSRYFSVQGRYSDGSRQDVSSQVVWDSDDVQLLSVSNDGPHAGQVQAGRPGSTQLRARLDGLEARAAVTVTAAELTGLRIETPAVSLSSGEALSLNVIGAYSDGSSQPLDAGVVWRSDDPALASVGNSAATRGRVQAGDARGGEVRISASYGGFTVTQALTITLDPLRPVSLVVLPGPNVLRNDNIDSSRIRVRLLAADASRSVADGTLVDVDVLQDGQSLYSTTVASSDGEAVLDFTTAATGLLRVEARVQGSEVSGRGQLYAGDNTLAVVLPAAFANLSLSGGVVPAGARFGFFLFNTSNRAFPLDAFVFRNGSRVLAEVTDSATLNGNVLPGGEKLGLVIEFSAEEADQGLNATYYLRDPSTGQGQSYSVVYSQPQ